MILLVVFMGVIFAVPVSAAKLVGSLDQSSIDGGILGVSGPPIHYKSIERAFTTGASSTGYVLTDVKIAIKTGASSRTPTAGIYANNAGNPGSKVHTLSGDVSSSGNREFTAPLGATLSAHTTYFFVLAEGGGSGSFQLSSASSTGIDSNPSTGWSMAEHSTYRRRNGGTVTTGGGGLRMGVFGVVRSSNSVATGKPSITGTVQIDSLLSADLSGIRDGNGLAGAVFTYQWVRVDGGTETDISGATGSTYTPVAADFVKRLKVKVSLFDLHGYPEGPLVSDATRIVRSSTGNAPAIGKPVVTGTSLFNRTLSVDTSGIIDENGVPDSFGYQWVRVDGGTETDISGATGSNYTVVFADVGSKLKVKVRFVDNDGHSEGPLVSDAREVPIPALVFGDSVKLVGNTVGATPGSVAVGSGRVLSQEFTTGSNISFLDKVVLRFASGALNSIPEVAIYEGSSRLYSLAGKLEALSTNTDFVAPANSFLKSNTVYSVRVLPAGSYISEITDTDSEDPGAADGWSIADGSRYRVSASEDFADRTFSLVMDVYGKIASWPDVVVSFDEAEYNVFEGGPPVDVVVRLDKDPVRTVTIPIVAMPAGGAVEGDYALSVGSVVFRSGETSKTFSVTANQDVDQNDESVVLGFGSPLPAGVSVGSVSGEMVELLDDEAPNRPATGVVNVTGLVAVGHNLVANLSGVSDPDGLEDPVYLYQWVRVDGGIEVEISGATGTTYTPVVADVGKRLKVKVSFEDYRSNLESFESVGVLVPEVALASSGVIFVPSNWSLVPEVLRSSVGSKFRLLFVSSGVRDARSSDIGSYNAFVTGVAEFGHAALRERHYFGHFRALASTSGVSAISNTDTGYSSSSLGVPIYWFGHRGRAAHDYREFYNGHPWRKGSGQNELGEAVAFTSADFIWTGTTNRGVSHGSPLGSSTPIVGRPGHSSGTQQFESQVKPSNDQLFPLYGLSMVFEVANYSPNSPAVGKPVVVGDVIIGEVLSVDASGIVDGDGIPDSFVYQWVRVDGGTETDISGATLDTYIMVADDVGKRLKVGVRFVDQWGSLEGPLVSDATGIVRSSAGNAPANGKPVITGTSRLNQTLAVDTSGISDGDGVPDSFVYQWVRVDGGTETDISGATGSTYVLVADDVGKRLKVEVSFTDDGGFSEGPLVSDATSTVLSSANSPPAFTSSPTFSVNENVRGVGTVVASDSDTEDSVTGYNVSGGVDRSLFSITNSGVLSFRSAPNYENPQDGGTNNVYVLVVTATSGTGSRVRTATESITVTVGDVSEPPSRPSAPVLSSPSSTSLLVSWSAPGGTGPSIIDYDVGYGRNSNGPFTDWQHSSAGRSATITGLNASTLYYVRVRAGNAEGNSSWSEVSNFTTRSVSPPPPPPTNNPPAFTSDSTFSVSENSRGVGTVVASDSDGQDSVTGYRVSGGVDRARFTSTSGGVLTFNPTPDYENPADSGRNNVYNIVVTATSGTGSRVRTATQSITVTVVDVVEVPLRPSVPVLSSPSSTSLLVSWSAPLNTGPAISDYDVQYRRGTTGQFTAWSHSGTGRTATITSLSANTLYQVQVRARNDEGNSSWSPTASFTTGSIQPPPPPPQTNNPPAFTSGSSFSVNENSRNVGTVVASDRDTQDSVTGYRVSGGVDSSRFSITNGGVLTFVSAPDFESPVDSGGNNVYDLVVTATSGTGSRVRTATQSITVTVVDLVEGPVVPPQEVVLVYNCG